MYAILHMQPLTFFVKLAFSTFVGFLLDSFVLVPLSHAKKMKQKGGSVSRQKQGIPCHMPQPPSIPKHT